MSLTATALAVGASLCAIGWLCATDPKRRRAFGLGALRRPRHARAALCGALLPGLLLTLVGASDVVVWLGSVSVLGWILAALPPRRLASLREALSRS